MSETDPKQRKPPTDAMQTSTTKGGSDCDCSGYQESSDDDVDYQYEDEVMVARLDELGSNQILDVLQSSTCRTILRYLHEEPAHTTELAERTDTSTQNVTHHLKKLQAADLVQVEGTVRSPKGRPMKVFAPIPKLVILVDCPPENTDDLVDELSAVLSKTD